MYTRVWSKTKTRLVTLEEQQVNQERSFEYEDEEHAVLDTPALLLVLEEVQLH